MTPFVQDADFTLYVGDVRECLRELPAESVHTVVTSPPYWGLRDYGTGSWEGGDPDCAHTVGGQVQDTKAPGAITTGVRPGVDASICRKCGATRVDRQIGLEATPDEFVAAMVDVFREVRRVLRDDGTLWLNLGDSYNAYNGGAGPGSKLSKTQTEQRPQLSTGYGLQCKTLKPKDLVGIPWRVAFALQADGWYLRSDIIWSKPNPMPESVTDRPTKAHEYVFLLSKGPRYFFDADAIREAHATAGTDKRASREHYDRSVGTSWHDHEQDLQRGQRVDEGRVAFHPAGRNVRSVWEIATQPYPEAHFATFPEALPERCIKAGTSERGCCPECGAPWVREVDREFEKTRGNAGPNLRDDPGGYDKGSKMDHPLGYGRYNVTTTGWKQACACSTHRGPVPCTVLDPFMGSGTTALVARRLGRRSVGVELNPEYAALCARRLQQLSLEFT